MHLRHDDRRVRAALRGARAPGRHRPRRRYGSPRIIAPSRRAARGIAWLVAHVSRRPCPARRFDEPLRRVLSLVPRCDERGAQLDAGRAGVSDLPARRPVGEIVRYFLRLGTLGFGGPVALVGLMEKQLVEERQWLTREEMRDAVAVSQSLPGPLAIQVGIFIAYLRGGFWGAWAGGWAFILPNFLIVATLAALYVHFGGLPWMTAAFYGIAPAVIALILHSCYRLAKLGMEDWLQWAIAAVCLIVTIVVQAEVAILFIGAGIIGIAYYGSIFRRAPTVLPAVAVVPAAAPALAPVATGSTLGKLLLF